MYINPTLGALPDPTGLTNSIFEIASLFGGKPSNFGAWATFDKSGHSIGSGGDKPNSNTVGMANAVGQGLSQWVAQMNAQGITFNAPSPFLVMIGQRDPSKIYAGSRPKGEQPLAEIGNPNDPNGTLQGAINWLKQYASGNPNSSVVQGNASPALPSPTLFTQPRASPLINYGGSAATPLINYGGSAATPIASQGYVPGYAQQTQQAGMLSGNLPMLLTIGGIGILAVAMLGSSAPTTRTITRRARRVSRR